MRPASADERGGPASESISRTLILGIDADGTIVQCGQHAPGAGEPAPQDVLGTHIGTLLADPQDHEQTLQQLLDAVRTRQERTNMLSIKADNGATREAVVTVKPMWSKDDEPQALMLIRVALPAVQRFSDPGLMRRAMLDEALTRVGGTLDFDQVARELVDVVVPAFCNAAGVLVLESIVGSDEIAPSLPDGSAVLRRLAVATDDDNPAWFSAFPTGEILTYPPATPYTRCMRTGRPVLEPHFERPAADRLARAWRRKPVSDLLGDVSMALLPLAARGSPLGFIVCIRNAGYRRFDAYDVEIGMEFAARASIFIENARRYSRERATALTLQRSLLPTRLSAPSTVEVRHRYLPGSKLIEVGGDWYESIALPGARVALVVGDVAGHGVRAAITMGRLRTALHTLAALELRPTEALQQLDELMAEVGQREPHFATCVYAVYDATTGTCEVASAGHLPPLLLRPDGKNEFLDVPPAPPLGVGGGTIESREFTVDDGSLFVLYTDGLVENRGRDIDDGLSRLRGVFGAEALGRPLEELAKSTLDGAYSDHYRDDIALLIARLRRVPEDHVATWELTAEPEAVRRGRALVREQLRAWDLEEMTFTTELLVSELITNAYWHATGRIELRLLMEKTLTCEVHDDSGALPRLRNTDEDDENGRGLQIVSRLAQRWGTRRTTGGKVVWCEQALPGSEETFAPTWPGEELHRLG